MPAKDHYHDTVKRALTKDGWTIDDEQDNRFKRISTPEAQSFRLQDQPKAAEAALNSDHSTSQPCAEASSEAFLPLRAGSFELPAARECSFDFEAIALDPRLVILVEVKELSDVDSQIEALANAVGKISMYRRALEYSRLNYPLFLAVSVESFEGILSEKIGELMLNHDQIPLVVFDPLQEEIVQWMP